MKEVAIDWARKKSENGAWFDGKKSHTGYPMVKAGLKIFTENMPKEQAYEYIKAGSEVWCCNTDHVKKLKIKKGITLPKSKKNPQHDIDAQVLFELAQADKEVTDHKKKKFRQYNLEQPLFDYYTTFKSIQKMKNATKNRIRYRIHPDINKVFGNIEETEKQIVKILKKELEKYPIYTEWMVHIKGISVVTGSGVISLIRDAHRFATVSKMWKYFGLDVQNGKAPCLRKGQKSSFSTKGRAFFNGVIADCFIKQRTPKYRDLYDRYKARKLEEGFTLGHAENMARRVISKEFLKDVWIQWRKVSPPVVDEFVVLSMEKMVHKSDADLLIEAV